MKLSRQYHPDHNPDDPEATKIMQVINLAYDVLSDPVRRREHDEWIARIEADKENSALFNSPNNIDKPSENVQPAPAFMRGRTASRHKKNSAFEIDKKAIGEHVFRHWFWYVLVIAIVTGFGYHSYTRSTYSPFSSTYRTVQKPANGKIFPFKNTDGNGKNSRTANGQETTNPFIPDTALPMQDYSRPVSLPESSWPKTASYLPGYEQHNANGLSSVTIDNSQNDSDVMVKLFYLEREKPHPVRTFYIPAHGTFKVDGVSAGKYDIRFRELQSGLLSRSDAFDLLEVSFRNGARFSTVNLSLSRLPNDEKQTWLAEDDF